MSNSDITVERDGGLWRVTLNRPSKANALSQDMLHELCCLFRAGAADNDLRALVIAGAGERAFCAGADLAEVPTSPDDPAYTAWRDLAKNLADLPILTIAMINGACIGGGLTLALGCDIRVCVPHSTFAYPVLKNGILLGERDANRLRDLIGPGRTSTLILGGSRIDANEAYTWGLVDRVVNGADLGQAVSELCETALNADREHLVTTKQCCRAHS
jgi:enoyl-CoA hydratase